VIYVGLDRTVEQFLKRLVLITAVKSSRAEHLNDGG